jgi:excisionase family DNA binding protein
MDLLTLMEVAKELKVTIRSVYRYKDLYGLPTVKVGKCYRVRRADLEKWIEPQPQPTP